MRSTMMDVPLTVTGIMRHGTGLFGGREVVTCTEEGARRQTYAETGARAARLANALRALGVDADQRVATLLWNNAEHLEAYLGVPSMGAVLHTLTIRLDPGVITLVHTEVPPALGGRGVGSGARRVRGDPREGAQGGRQVSVRRGLHGQASRVQ